MSTKGAISEIKIILSSAAAVENNPIDSFGTSYISTTSSIAIPHGHKACENMQGWASCDLKMQHNNLVFLKK